MTTELPAPRSGKPRGCLLWAGIGLFVLVLALAGGAYWFFDSSTKDPEVARAWALEMLDLGFPPETPPATGLRIGDSMMVWAGHELRDRRQPSVTVVGTLAEERLDFDQLAALDQDADAEVQVAERAEIEMRVRGAPIRAMRTAFADGTVDLALLLDGKETAAGRRWRVMLIFAGPAATVTEDWVQATLDTIV